MCRRSAPATGPQDGSPGADTGRSGLFDQGLNLAACQPPTAKWCQPGLLSMSTGRQPKNNDKENRAFCMTKDWPHEKLSSTGPQGRQGDGFGGGHSAIGAGCGQSASEGLRGGNQGQGRQMLGWGVALKIRPSVSDWKTHRRASAAKTRQADQPAQPRSI